MTECDMTKINAHIQYFFYLNNARPRRGSAFWW